MVMPAGPERSKARKHAHERAGLAVVALHLVSQDIRDQQVAVEIDNDVDRSAQGTAGRNRLDERTGFARCTSEPFCCRSWRRKGMTFSVPFFLRLPPTYKKNTSCFSDEQRRSPAFPRPGSGRAVVAECI